MVIKWLLSTVTGKYSKDEASFIVYLESVYKVPYSVMPDLIRHPETLDITGFRLEFTPYLIRDRNDEFFGNRWFMDRLYLYLTSHQIKLFLSEKEQEGKFNSSPCFSSGTKN